MTWMKGRYVSRAFLTGVIGVTMGLVPARAVHAQPPAKIDSALKAAYAKYKSNDSGAVADDIPRAR